MKVFQLKLFYFYNKSVLLKAIMLLTILLFCLFNLSAQEERNIKLKIEAGLLQGVVPVLERGGFFFRVEPKLKTSKNTVIGLRIGATLNSQFIRNNDPLQFYIDNVFESPRRNGILSFVPTLDYYIIKKSFRPFLGLGIGYYFLNTYKEVSRSANNSDVLEVSVNNQVGFLLRGGFDLRKLIIGLEFNYIPKADIEIQNRQIIGTIDSSYIGLSVGYIIGDGKSSK